MTVQDLIDAASAYIDDDIELADAIIATNEAQARIGDMAFIYDGVTLNGCIVNTWYDLPAEVTTIVAVKRDDGKRYTNYRKLGQRIEFAHPGTYSVEYRRMPVAVSKATDAVEVPAPYHSALVTYMRYWAKAKEDEDSEDGMRLKQEFYLETDRAYRALLKSERKGLGIQLRVERSPFA
jgi:hypothetical protein